MEHFYTNESGNEIIRRHIAKNPELQRLVVGQSYANAPEKLLEKNEIKDYFTRLNPDIKKLMEQQRQAVSHAKNAEKLASHYQTEANRVEEAAKESRTNQQKRRDLDVKISEHRKNLAKLDKDLKETQAIRKERYEVQRKIRESRKHIKAKTREHAHLRQRELEEEKKIKELDNKIKAIKVKRANLFKVLGGAYIANELTSKAKGLVHDIID